MDFEEKIPNMFVIELTRESIKAFDRFNNLTAYWQEKRMACVHYRNPPVVSDFIRECSEHLENFPWEQLLPLAEQGDPEAVVEMGMRYVTSIY